MYVDKNNYNSQTELAIGRPGFPGYSNSTLILTQQIQKANIHAVRVVSRLLLCSWTPARTIIQKASGFRLFLIRYLHFSMPKYVANMDNSK